MEIKTIAQSVVVGFIVILMIDPAEMFVTFVAGGTIAGMVVIGGLIVDWVDGRRRRRVDDADKS